ncbi:lipase [Thiohalorhabdus denitrificans]|uniref:Lipase (Class 3) n=1 Tax=Thiohalorhabdus denitrificans TaxID=381306 RepID=A0A0P9GN34_9GAMM|nr:lipase family protein [Thiohalorhabdus denitrificans]KPV41859.1 lipase [Thiohalorhabdus denitrificans]SCY64757.1 Lipase (class 3) [Thiohalorhabdus denitrificans]
MGSYFEAERLLNGPPVTRAAYSDRTAWIMAELSRLVYEPLPAEVSITRLVHEIKESVAAGEDEDAVASLVKRAMEAEQGTSTELVSILREADFELLESFDEGGTQAFLARFNPGGSFEGMLILAFRGTEMEVADIFADIKADLRSAPGGGRVHRGFLEAFERVKEPISRALDRHAGPPLYITGHSLGGALATLATRYLEKDGTGACYTFGGPRVGDRDFFSGIKTPVYRVVNAADGVPRVPFGYGFNMFSGFIGLFPGSIPKRISSFLENFRGYTHFGYQVFLNAPPNRPDEYGVPFKKLRVDQSPNFFRKARLVLFRWVKTWGAAAAQDHGSGEYAEKLKAYALRRNPE